MRRYNPLKELLLFRLRLHYREPAVIFWGYGFPLLLTIALGLAFRNKGPETIEVDIEDGPLAAKIAADLHGQDPKGELFEAEVRSAEHCAERLRLAKTAVVVAGVGEPPVYVYRFDPTRPEAVTARHRVDDALQRAVGRADAVATKTEEVAAPGSRYIDFLVPGLLGMNIMGTGLWGVGFVLVEMRVRKLLRRFAATPMRPSHFMYSLLGAPMILALPELVVVLVAGVLMFGIPVRGSVLALLVVVLAGSLCFAGLGLLVSCRAKKTQTVMGLMNVVMMPMWLMSGIFFATDNFPGWMQPVVSALPLTHLNRTLRAIILEGASLPSQWLPLTVLTAVGVATTALAIRWFRWS